MSSSDFARKQLEKHGWKEGAGLGKEELGRTEPIKPFLKFDKTGVGHDPGKEFTDHWWMRVFNDAAKKIGNKKEEQPTQTPETKKQEEMSERKKKFYSQFVQSSILSNGVEEKDADTSSDEEETETQESLPTLDDLHKYCGGATGSRAGQLGIKMQGKLARVAAYDKMYKEKLEANKLMESITTTGSDENSEDKTKRKKSKKEKRKNKDKDNSVVDEAAEVNVDDDDDSSLKKKKKRRKSNKDQISDGHLSNESDQPVSNLSELTNEERLSSSQTDEVMNSNSVKKKKKRKHTEIVDEEDQTNEDGEKKKKKRKDKTKEESSAVIEELQSFDSSQDISERKKKKKDKRRSEEKEETSIGKNKEDISDECQTESVDGNKKKKKKKKKKD